MGDIAIRITSLGKRYKLGDRPPYATLRDSIARVFAAPLRRASARPAGDAGADGQTSGEEWLWALKDLSLEIPQGDIVGIVGNNGAGKSTLLKILSRITEPTEGRVEIRGRIGSLLEVGTGFHHELSGHENVYLNGAILGMRRSEIRRKFDEIVAFAEVERFINVPVKHYSSGMYMRLAFAVAAHLEPEILLVDEVLAVGDAGFQEKCLGKMSDIARQGRTVLFVSHNLAAVQSLCRRAILLEHGRLASQGPPSRVVSDYLEQSFAVQMERRWDEAPPAPGNDRIRLLRATIRPTGGEVGDPITIRTHFSVEIDFWNARPGRNVKLRLHVYDQHASLVFATTPIIGETWQRRPLPIGRYRSTCHVPGDLLNDGLHYVDVIAVQDDTELIYSLEHALTFVVHDAAEMRDAWHGKWPGAVRPNLTWTTERIATDFGADANGSVRPVASQGQGR
jgi:lipopolysaccharide transport system ATP-binding protein